MLPLVPAVFCSVKARHKEQGSPTEGWIFPQDTRSGHLESDGLAKDQHALAVKNSKVKSFEPYCLRHTALSSSGQNSQKELLVNGLEVRVIPGSPILLFPTQRDFEQSAAVANAYGAK
jgi:hypothetical protein